MRFALFFAAFFALVALVSASAGANAERMRRGLPPLKPRTMYAASPAEVAKRSTASSAPSQCTSGPVQCCDTFTNSGDSAAALIIGLLGIVLGGVDVPVGLDCSPISVIGVGGTTCESNTLCCDDDSFNGLIAIGCVPINISL